MDGVSESILNSVKKLLGIEPDQTDFDADIAMHINSAIMILRQLGVGPEEGFFVTSSADTYWDYLGEDSLEIPMVKLYLFYKTKLGFDPPSNSSVSTAIQQSIDELEWRLNAQVDYAKNTLG